MEQFITKKIEEKLSPITQFVERYKLPPTLRPWQSIAISMIKEIFSTENGKKGMLVCVPTAAGKSTAGEYACEVTRQMRGLGCAVIAPLKALATEHLTQKWGKHFNSMEITGDSTENKKWIVDPSIECFTFTFEMMFQYVIKNDDLLKRLGCIVFDEAHFLGDKSRGWKLEVMMNLIQTAHPHIKLILLSATVGNATAFAEHFDLALYEGDPVKDRPFELKIFHHMSAPIRKSADKLEFYKLQVNQIVNFYLMKYGKENMPSMLFFCTTKVNSRVLSEYFNATFSKQGLKSIIHNRKVSKEERQSAENAFRSKEMKFIFCTTTLAMGLDTPCDVVVMLGESFFIWLKKMEVMMQGAMIKQISGRAGRGNGMLKNADGKIEGHAHIVYQEQNEDYIRHYLETSPIVQSRIIPYMDEYERQQGDEEEGREMDESNLDCAILGWIYGSSKPLTKEEVKTQFFLKIFRKSEEINVEDFNTTYNWLQIWNFIDGNGNLTRLGKTTMLFAIKPKTAIHVINVKNIMEKSSEKMSIPELFTLMFVVPEMTDQVDVNTSNDERDAREVSYATRFVNFQKINHAIDKNDYFAQLLENRRDHVMKAFAMLYHFDIEDQLHITTGIEKIACNANDMFIIKTAISRVLTAAGIILGNKWKYASLTKLMQKGINLEEPQFNESVLSLCQISGIGKKTAEGLIAAGINSIFDFIRADASSLAQKIKEMKLTTMSETNIQKKKAEAKLILVEQVKEMKDQLKE